jgi:hypothetical protein
MIAYMSNVEAYNCFISGEHDGQSKRPEHKEETVMQKL